MTTPDPASASGAAIPGEVAATLRDGTPVLVRPIRPDDKDLLRDGFARLSEESRLRRFLAPISALTEPMLRYLTEVDYANHFAWVAVRADDVTDGMGVARYVRLADDPSVAEAAITVIDEYQGRGLGTLLLGLLAARAREVGVRAFRAYVLEDNAPMRALIEEFGTVAHHESPGVLVFDAPLDPDRLPDSPAGKVFRAVATEAVPARARIQL